MKTFIVTLKISLLLTLAGCAATPLTENPNAGYFLVSTGGVSGVVQMISGGIRYCKVTQSNLGSTEFNVDISYDGDVCLVEAHSNDKTTEVLTD